MALLAAAVLVFLVYWYFEAVFWAILSPLAFTSLYLAWRLWRPSRATSRAVIYWAISIAWVLALVLVSFKDVTAFGGIVGTAVASGAVVLVYGCVRKSIASA
jgi:hypothetical protein